MPKRDNPFGDGSPIQLKSHIGTKEIDLGIAHGAKMQEVYDKTKHLLFAGSKKSTSSHKCEMEVDEAPKPLPGQLRLDSDGQIFYQESKPATNGLGQGTHTFSFRMETDHGNNNNHLVLPAGQLQIDSSGHLVAGMKVPQPSPVSPNSCQMCSKRLERSIVVCSFCERKLCADCVHVCDNCSGNFCHLCSVVSYEGIADGVRCLQCS